MPDFSATNKLSPATTCFLDADRGERATGEDGEDGGKGKDNFSSLRDSNRDFIREC